MSRHDRGGKDTFRLSRAAVLPRLFKPNSLNMVSSYQIQTVI